MSILAFMFGFMLGGLLGMVLAAILAVSGRHSRLEEQRE